MKFTTIIPVMLVTLLPLASAVDLRILVKFKKSAYPSGDAFCTTWLSTCRAYQPKDTTLFYAGSLCEPGDYSGKNKRTEARVYCAFEKPVSNGVVAQLGIESI